MQWLLKLLPQQKMQEVGNGNVQAGRVDGGLHHSHHTTHNIHNNFFVMGAQTSATSTPETGPPDAKHQPMPKVEIKDYQRALLRLLMNHHAYEGTALRFCQREFGTDRIKRLNELQCRRVTRYVQECMRRDSVKLTVESS